MLKKGFAFIAIFAVILPAETIILQNGLNGYEGTEDVTIFSDGKAENYSWYNDQNGPYWGAPDDSLLVNCDFCC